MKELGTVIYNCTCAGYDIKKIFSINWDMAQEGSQLPVEWPEKYQTEYNKGNTTFSYVFKLARKTLIS